MNDVQFAAYSEYLRDLANRLLLADWEVELGRSKADDDAWAQVRVSDVENHARIKVNWPEFFHRTPEEQREWLTHECLHLHLDRPDRIVAQLAEQWSENSATQFAKTAHSKEIEICVQRLARLLAPHLPLPPKVKA